MRYAVECDMRREFRDLIKFFIRIDGSIRMGKVFHLVDGKIRLWEWTGCGATDIFTHDWEYLPQRKGLECHDDFHSCTLRHRFDEAQIGAQMFFTYHIAWWFNICVVWYVIMFFDHIFGLIAYGCRLLAFWISNLFHVFLHKLFRLLDILILVSVLSEAKKRLKNKRNDS